eukprot:1140942-Pelagomonas_calceolata.AAC.2
MSSRSHASRQDPTHTLARSKKCSTSPRPHALWQSQRIAAVFKEKRMRATRIPRTLARSKKCSMHAASRARKQAGLVGSQAKLRMLWPPKPRLGHTATAELRSTRCREILPSLMPHRKACMCACAVCVRHA